MQDFGKIKTVFNDILIEGIVKKDVKSKKLFKKYLKTIKESEILTTQFLVYNNIETRVDQDFNSASLYINENLNLFRKYKIEDIVSENEKLAKLLGDKLIPQENKLFESLSYLIQTPRTARNMSQVSEELKTVIEYVKNNKAPEVSEGTQLPNSFIGSFMVQKFNEKYGQLEGDEKELLRAALNPDVAAQQEYYKKTVKECLDSVENLLKEASDESKDKLLKVKAKLTEEQDVPNELFFTKMGKLITLKHNLLS